LSWQLTPRGVLAPFLRLAHSTWLDSIQLELTPTGQPNVKPHTALIAFSDGTEHDTDGPLVPKPDALPQPLYAECKRHETACKVIISVGNPQRHETSEAETYAPYLLRLAVASSDMLLESASLTTYENARNIARMLRGEHYDTLILVTSAYHMPCVARFRPIRFYAAANRVQFTPCPTRVWPTFSNLINAQIALHEWIGIAVPCRLCDRTALTVNDRIGNRASLAFDLDPTFS
jgi:hypothetical protein